MCIKAIIIYCILYFVIANGSIIQSEESKCNNNMYSFFLPCKETNLLSNWEIVECELNFIGNTCKFLYNFKSSQAMYSLVGDALINNLEPHCEAQMSNLTEGDCQSCNLSKRRKFLKHCIAPRTKFIEYTLEYNHSSKKINHINPTTFRNLRQLNWINYDPCRSVNEIVEKLKYLDTLILHVDGSNHFYTCKYWQNINQEHLKELHIFVDTPSNLSLSNAYLNGVRNLEIFELNAADHNFEMPLDIPKQMFQGLTNLSTIVIENAGKTVIEKEHFQNLTNLKVLRLKHILIDGFDWISSETLQNHLEHLELTDSNSSNFVKKLLGYLGDYAKLSTIEVSAHSNFAYDIYNYNISAFICYENEKTCQFISDINKRPCPVDCLCTLKHQEMRFEIDCHKSKILTEIPELPIPIIGNTSLNFSNKNLTILPNRTLYGYAEVRELHLSNNQLANLSFDQLPINLSYLDLSGNHFETLDKRVVQFLSNRSDSLRIKLSENPWICNCKNLHLVEFVSNYSHIEDRENILCSDAKFGEMAKLSRIDLCGLPFNYTNALIIVGINAAIVAIIIIFFQYKQFILIWLYENNICLGCISRPEPEDDIVLKNDAFIAFCHLDLELVESYVEKLENGAHRYKLCYYHRDWLPGESIPDCILKSIEESRRIIILMTKHFIESPWGRFEFRSAIRAASVHKLKRLIVILYPGVDFNSLDSELKSYLKYNTYLPRDHPHFWRSLMYAMPHNHMQKDRIAQADVETHL